MAGAAPDGSTFVHGRPGRVAILLVQLGTPQAPEPTAVRRYLAEFLSDPRVVEIPRLLWLPVLHGIVLRTRPAKSAAKYASIWTAEGSPLAVTSQRQTTMLRGWLGERGHDVEVALAMRYGEPSLPTVLRELRDKQVDRLLVLPMYPQYSASTTATVFDAIAREFAGWRNLPELRLVRSFHDHPAYIHALGRKVGERWAREGRPQQLVMSFHGVPQRSLALGDPYHCECHKTARLLAEALGLAADQYVVSFQSRFGRAEWLKPYTMQTLEDLARRGVGRVDVVCPGFVADCLETLEEIAMEARAAFLEAGGEQFRYLQCPNEAPEFIDALALLVEEHMAGWSTRRLQGDAERGRDAELAASASRAKLMGAAR